MAFQQGAFASVWSVQKGKGNYYDVRISTSRKNKQTGEYTTDFSGFTRFCGDAATAISQFEGQDSKDNDNKPITRVRLGDVSTSNHYDREKNTTYYNCAVFNYTDPDSQGNSSSAGGSDPFMDIPAGSSEELPFS